MVKSIQCNVNTSHESVQDELRAVWSTKYVNVASISLIIIALKLPLDV